MSVKNISEIITFYYFVFNFNHHIKSIIYYENVITLFIMTDKL